MNANFSFAGVGGQGILVAAELVALVGLELGLDVKQSEIHGVAQRGGSVSSQVRWGARVHSPLIPPGEVDFLLAFERLEALRYLDMLRPGGTVLVNDYCVAPVSVTSGADTYPTLADEEEAYADIRHHRIAALRLALELGNPKVSNVVLLGALSALVDAPQEVWERTLAARFPAPLAALNARAFAAGRACLVANKELALAASHEHERQPLRSAESAPR